jgi:DNA-binding winged helix-turn-helix (wHTH) protein
MEIVRFGLFEVNLQSGELRKRGVRLALQEQPLRILAALLEAPGQIVGREALCRRLWPQGTFVDFEHSLNAAIRRLRVTLGDEAEVSRFIETVPRRGYRFIGLTSVAPTNLVHHDSLSTSHAVGGEPQPDGHRLRVSIELIDTPGHTHVWVATFDRPVTDASRLHREVTDAIAKAVRETKNDAVVGF